MRSLLTFFLTGLLTITARGQYETLKDADSLLRSLKSASSDTSRILSKCRLAEAYRSAQPDTAFILAYEALESATKIKFRQGEVQAHLVLSVLHREKGDLAPGLDEGLQAIKIAKEEGYSYGEIRGYIRISNVYLTIKDPEKAIHYLKKADNVLKTDPDYFIWSAVRSFMADAYEQLNKTDSAALEVDQLEKGHSTHPLINYHIKRLRGNIALKRNDFRQAIENYRESGSIAIGIEAYRDAATIVNSMAVVFRKLNEPDSAIYYAKQGLKYGEMLAYKNRVLAASNLLAELYEERNPEEAIKYYKIASAAKDSLYGIEKMQQLQLSIIKEQERQAEAEAGSLAYRNKIKQIALLSGVIAFLIIAIILFRNNRLKQKAKLNIEKAYDELKVTQQQLIQAEKMASLGELTAGIAHEIQNPLNFVNNFSEVNRELISELVDEVDKGNTAEVKAIATDIQENSKKINEHGKRADAIVKGMLQHSRTGSAQKEPTDINTLADEYLRLAYHGLRAKDKSFNARFETAFDTSIGKISVVPQDIGRVLLNLINNAFYAVREKKKLQPDNYEPTIAIRTKKTGHKVELTVSDNGNGIPAGLVDKIFQPFFTTKPTGQGTGLGLSLAYDIVTKGHGGELKVNTSEGEGTEFTIIIPKSQADRQDVNA